MITDWGKELEKERKMLEIDGNRQVVTSISLKRAEKISLLRCLVEGQKFSSLSKLVSKAVKDYLEIHATKEDE